MQTKAPGGDRSSVDQRRFVEDMAMRYRKPILYVDSSTNVNIIAERIFRMLKMDRRRA